MMKKIIALVALSALSLSALATGSGQTVTTSGLNSGSISNTVKANASVTGVGTSISGATGSASATANVGIGSVITNTNANCVSTVGGSGSVSGNTATTVTGTAFNYSSGSGATGSASSTGAAVAHADGSLSYSAPGQSLKLNGVSDSHVNGSVSATQNQGGAFSNAADGSFVATGYVGSVITREKTTNGCGVSCGPVTSTVLTGNVTDTKTANASVVNTTLTVTGLPSGAVLGNATVGGNASSNTVVNASFADPK